MSVMMIPNIIYGILNKNLENKCKNKSMNIIEQIGRYGCFFLICFHIGLWEKGFASKNIFLIWGTCVLILLFLYLVSWVSYFIHANRFTALTLAILPSILFITSGILMRNYLLLICGIIFSIGHVYITDVNNR